jgi:hypothetical protein
VGVLLFYLVQTAARGRLGDTGNGRWSAGMSSPACSNQGEGKPEMLSRRFLVMV